MKSDVTGPGIDFRGLRQRFDFHGVEICEDLPHLVELIDAKDRRWLDLGPNYQRPAVWSDAQAALFVGSWAEGLELPKIFLQRYQSAKTGGEDWLDRPIECLDGQQRLKSLYRWVKGFIPAELSDGRMVWYKDTSVADRRWMDVRVTYVDLCRADQLKLYIRLNRGGTAHTDAEILHAKALLDQNNP